MYSPTYSNWCTVDSTVSDKNRTILVMIVLFWNLWHIKIYSTDKGMLETLFLEILLRFFAPWNENFERL